MNGRLDWNYEAIRGRDTKELGPRHIRERSRSKIGHGSCQVTDQLIDVILN